MKHKKLLIFFAVIAALVVAVGATGCIFSGRGKLPAVEESTAVNESPETAVETAVRLENQVLFVPGWKAKSSINPTLKERMEKIFRAKEISVWSWESDCNWDDAKKNAESAAQEVYAKIAVMSEKERQNLILAGHSIGCRVVTRAAKLLHEQKIQVKQIILLGAAVNFDDPDLESCAASSKEPFINVFNSSDNILKLAYANKENALPAGFCGIKEQYPNMKQYRKYAKFDNIMANVFEHYIDVYMDFFSEISSGQVEEYIPKIDHHKIKFEKTALSLPFYLDAPGAKLDEPEFHGWKFCYYDLKSYKIPFKDEPYRSRLWLIINPYGKVMWNVRRAPLLARWNEIEREIKAQLNEK